MKRFGKKLQCGNDVELNFNYTVNGVPTDLGVGDDYIIAIYNINRRCLYNASISDGKIEKCDDVGKYKVRMGFEDTVNMPDRTILEMVVKEADGTVKHIEEDVMLEWVNNNINDLLR